MAKSLDLNVVLSTVDKTTKHLKQIGNVSGRTAKALKATQGELGDLNKAQKQLGQFNELKRGSVETSRQLREQQDQVRQLTEKIETTSGATKRLNQQRGAAIRRAKKLKAQYQGEQDKLQGLRHELNKVDGLTGSLSDKEQTLNRRIKAANARIQKQKDALTKLGKADVGGKFNKMTSEVGRFARNLTFGIGGAAAGIFGLANSTASLGDNVAKTASKVGLSIKALQEYRYAAERSGVSTEKFDSSFERFVKRTGEAATGTGAAKDAFKELNIDAKKLANMNPAKAFETVSDRLASVHNQTRRVALAAAIFGREGVGMVNMIKGGSAGLHELAKAAEATGYVLSKQAAHDAETFKDSLLDAQLSLTGIKNTIGAQLMPAVSDLMNQLSRWIQKNRDQVAEFAKTFGTKLKAAIPVIAELGRGLWAAAKVFAAVVNQTAAMVGGFDNLGAILGAVFAGKAIMSILSFGGAILKAGSALASLSSALPIVATGLRAISVALLTNPIGLAVAALAGLAYVIYRNWGDISDWFSQRWQDIKTACSEGVSGVNKLLLDWSPMGLLYKAIIAGLKALGVDIPTQFQSLGSAMVDGIIGGIEHKYDQLKHAVQNLGYDTAKWFAEKLGIKSPSRVFIGYGQNTVEGYRLGIARHEPTAVKQVSDFGRRIRSAGAGLGLAAATMPAMAAAVPAAPRIGFDMPSLPRAIHHSVDLANGGSAALRPSQPIAFDQRPAMQAPASSAGRSEVSIHINGDINVNNGRDEQAFLALIESRLNQALDQRDREADARRRSALYDTH